VFRRLFDGIEPGVVDIAASTIRGVEGVKAVDDLRVRWHGHQLRVTASISVGPELSVKQGHDIAHNVEHELHHRFATPLVATFHVEPHDHADRHDATAHHTGQWPEKRADFRDRHRASQRVHLERTG
jgi:divalent metal cation (Fe/Co/Zn/Cd) transporter